MVTKKCPKCQVRKKVALFHLNKNRPDGYAFYCKHCQAKVYKKHWLSSGYEKFLLKVYGLTIDMYNIMLDKQKNVCAICKCASSDYNSRINKTRRLAIDHCHTTLKVRGLLCSKCNRGIGLFDDDTKILLNARDYLRVNK